MLKSVLVCCSPPADKETVEVTEMVPLKHDSASNGAGDGLVKDVAPPADWEEEEEVASGLCLQF